MKPAGIVGTAALSLLLGATAPGWTQQGKPNEDKADKQDAGEGQARARKEQRKGEKQKAEPPAKGEQPQQEAATTFARGSTGQR
jgi:hypothetical protein